MGEGKLRITSEAAEAIRGAEVVFICGGTPSRADGSPNVAHVQQTTRVRLHDPVALGHVRDRFADANFCDKAEDAVRDAHAVVVRTEWDEYRAIAPERLAELLEYPIVVDARNVWRQDDLLAAGLTVGSVGSPLVPVPGA